MSIIGNSLPQLLHRVLVGSLAALLVFGGAVGVANAATSDDPGATVVEGSPSSSTPAAPLPNASSASSSTVHADSVAASGPWTAIEVGFSSGHVGLAAGYATEDAANKAAKKKCDRSDCQFVIAVKNGCSALAQAPNGNVGWGGSRSRKAADQKAISETGNSKARLVGDACAGAWTR